MVSQAGEDYTRGKASEVMTYIKAVWAVQSAKLLLDMPSAWHRMQRRR